MKKFFAAYFLLPLLLQGASAQTQPDKYPVRWNAFISVDYAGAVSGDIRNYYDGIVDLYRSEGIPIPTQTKFGTATGISAGVFLSRLKNIWAGISIGYSSSPAYSIYKDYSGTLKINGNITSAEILLNLKILLVKTNGFQADVKICPGVSFTTLKISREINYSMYPDKNLYKSWRDNAWGPSCKAKFGISIPVSDFLISFEGGYMANLNNVPKDRVYKNTGMLTESGWNIGMSGYIIDVSIGTEF